jgi:hypothetical protein
MVKISSIKTEAEIEAQTQILYLVKQFISTAAPLCVRDPNKEPKVHNSNSNNSNNNENQENIKYKVDEILNYHQQQKHSFISVTNNSISVIYPFLPVCTPPPKKKQNNSFHKKAERSIKREREC